MAKKKIYKTKKEKAKVVKEPVSDYIPRLQIFSSFEEAEMSELRESAKRTPEERLRDTVSLIKRVFAKELKENTSNDNRIYFPD